MNSRQLRVTLATRLALKGYGLGAIAKALDHSNLESVLSYAKKTMKSFHSELIRR
ncbi:tyrosine-type recombinase/integrase [Escherichia coli]|uniref:tyrosine-type recombinase/integrase n=1 Tax=Escherichia coli TaxID=562 RepID=UPI00203286D0|nr:tyrosine-type recombinase/integrase [Escherichia coli]